LDYELLAVLFMIGGIVGVMAGLLGIGGGIIVVPSLLWLLPKAGIGPDNIMHIALATSLATIIVTSTSSVRSHLKNGNVDLFVVKWLIPGVVSGGFLGAYVAELVPAELLPKIFSVILLTLALQMILSVKTTAAREMPGKVVTLLFGVLIGTVSTLAGIGGGSLTVPFLSRFGVEMRKAIGSASACGFMIAVSGMLGFILHSTGSENLPDYSVGYVYLPALLAIVAASVFTTRIGVSLASRLPTRSLKKVFAMFLLFVAGKMLFI
jgi:uncharacterized membrane protein YfcA